MGKIAKRSRIKPFIKCVNYNHLMPTRYSLDLELKSVVTTDIVAGSNPTARSNCRKDVKKLLEDKYNTCVKTGKNKWFFQVAILITSHPAVLQTSACFKCAA